MNIIQSIIYTVIIISSYLVDINAKSQYEVWKEHGTIVSQFECGAPQPRSMDIRQFLSEKTLRSAWTISPESTVLHRCESAGCCSMNKKCLPVMTEEVDLVFHVRFQKRKYEFIEIKATNHTKCACQSRTNNPK